MSTNREQKRTELLHKRTDVLSSALGRLMERGLLDDDTEFTMLLAEYLTGNMKIDTQLASHARTARALMQAARDAKRRSKKR